MISIRSERSPRRCDGHGPASQPGRESGKEVHEPIVESYHDPARIAQEIVEALPRNPFYSKSAAFQELLLPFASRLRIANPATHQAGLQRARIQERDANPPVGEFQAQRLGKGSYRCF